MLLWSRLVVLFSSMQITRAHYQNGLLASKLDSMPQSPEGSHMRLDTSISLPPVTPPGSRNQLPQATPPPINHGSMPQAAPPSASAAAAVAVATSNLHTSKSQQSPSSAGPDNGPGESTALLGDQQNCVALHRPSNSSGSTSQPQPHPLVHTISHAHTESTI